MDRPDRHGSLEVVYQLSRVVFRERFRSHTSPRTNCNCENEERCWTWRSNINSRAMQAAIVKCAPSARPEPYGILCVSASSALLSDLACSSTKHRGQPRFICVPRYLQFT